MRTVTWMSRRDAESFQFPNDKIAWISLTDPALPEAKVPHKEGLILRLKFHDADGKHSVVMDGTPQDKLTFFQHNDALAIISFIDDVKDKVDHINVHCEGGISRSAAVARFIAEMYGLTESYNYMKSYDLYNKYVYSTLRSVYFALLMGEKNAQGVQ